MDGFQNNCVEQKSHDSVHTIFYNLNKHKMTKTGSATLEIGGRPEGEEVRSVKRHKKTFGVMDLFTIFSVIVVLCQTHKIIHFKYVQIILQKLYLSRVIKNKNKRLKISINISKGQKRFQDKKNLTVDKNRLFHNN